MTKKMVIRGSLIVFVVIAVLIYLPIIFAFRDAFFTDTGIFTPKYLLDALTRENIRRSLVFTATQALISSSISVAIGSFIALGLSITRIRGEALIQAVSLLAFMAPPMIVVTGFIMLYGDYGYITRYIPWLGFLGHGFWSIIGAHVFYNIPLAMNLVYSSLISIPRELLDSMVIYSKGRLGYVARKVFLPYMVPAMISSFILIYIYCFTSFAIPLSLGGIRYSTLEVYIYRYYKLSFNTHIASSIAFIQYIILQVLVIGLLLAYRKTRREMAPIGYFRYEISVSKPMKLVYRLVTYITLIYFILPLVIIPYSAFINPYTDRLNPGVFSEILDPGLDPGFGVTMGRIYLNTIYYASSTVLITIVLALLIIYYTPGIVDSMYISLLAISPLTLSLGLLRTYGLFLPPPVLIVFAHTIASLPLVVRILRLGFMRISEVYLNVARVFGEKGIPLVFRVILPLMKPSLILGIMFTVIISLGEFSATYFIATSQDASLSIAIYMFMGLRKWQESSATAMILLLITSIIIYSLYKRGARWEA